MTCPNYLDAKCDSLGDTLVISNFCAASTNAGDAYRRDGCNSIGISGEYGIATPSGRGPGCTYKSGSQPCTPGGIVGQQGVCQRTAFLGDLEKCCTNNLGQCFVNNDQTQGTCPPDARSNTGQGCINFYTGDSFTLGYCDPLNYDQFKERWAPTGYCAKAVAANALAQNYVAVEQLGNVMMSNYFNRFPLSAPGQSGYDPFQQQVLSICQTNPTACASYLQNNLCKDYDRSSVIDSKDRQNFCGCSLPTSAYNSFLNSEAGIGRECDSVCTPAQVIKPVINGSVIRCNQTVCSIDDVTINLINSSVGDISLSQVCGGCSGGNCNCFFKDVNINGENSKFKNINFDQDCSSQKCYITSETTGLAVEVDCKQEEQRQQDDANADPGPDQTKNNRPAAITFIIIGVLIVVLFIILLLIIFLKKK